jgi:hypothetical protein
MNNAKQETLTWYLSMVCTSVEETRSCLMRLACELYGAITPISSSFMPFFIKSATAYIRIIIKLSPV